MLVNKNTLSNKNSKNLEERLTFNFMGEVPLPKSDVSNEKPASIVSLALPSLIFFSILLSFGYGSTEIVNIQNIEWCKNSIRVPKFVELVAENKNCCKLIIKTGNKKGCHSKKCVM